jgi:hypothetical protein
VEEITIDMAKQISVKTDYQEIVIFGYNPINGNQIVVTYGRSKEQSEDAARAGNYLKKSLGWADELCHAKPKRTDPSVYETVQQYKERTGEEYPDKAPVFYKFDHMGDYDLTTYEFIKECAARSESNTLPDIMICGNESGYPPNDWRPE